MAKDWHVIPLYGVALQEARASGDVEAMQTVARRAESEGGGDPEIQRLAAELRAEIARLRGGGGGRYEPRVLYGEAMQQARASGDVAQMRELIQRAKSEGSGDPEIQRLAVELRAEIERLRAAGGGRYEPRPLYGEAMQQARASGDVAQMRELIQRAETEGAGDPEIQAALGDLRAALSRAGGALPRDGEGV